MDAGMSLPTILQNRQLSIVIPSNHGRSRDALKIAPELDQREAGRRCDQGLDFLVLPVSELEQQVSPRAEAVTGVRHHPGHDAEAVDAAKKRDGGFVLADLGLQAGPAHL